MRRVRIDNRGQAIQVGAVLLFGMAVVSFSLYVATVVPQQNEQVEFGHFQDVQSDMEEVRSAIVTVGGTGTTESVTVELGTSYPSRALALNPIPPSGSLRTTTRGQIQFNRTFDTSQICGYSGTASSLVYRPDYNELAAQTVEYDSTAVVVNGTGSENYAVLSGQSVIQNDTIRLSPLNASFETFGTDRESLDFKAGPIAGDIATVETGLVLTMPTRLPASVWETNDKLFGETESVKSVTPAQNQKNAVNVTLEPGRYQVTCRAVSVNSFPASGSASGTGIESITWLSPADSPGAQTNPAEDCSQVPCDPLHVSSTKIPTQVAAPVGFGSNNTGVGEFNTSMVATDSDGNATTGLILGRTGNATLTTASDGNSDTLTIGTFVNRSFETDLGAWEAFGTFTDGSPQTSTTASNQGSQSVEIDGGNDGGIRTAEGMNTSDAELAVVEYWAQEDGAEVGDSNGDENLVVEYLEAGGNVGDDTDWVKIDTLAAEGADPSQAYERRGRITAADAFHDNFRIRFRQVAADAGSDEWYVDDVRISQLGGTSGGMLPGAGAPASQIVYNDDATTFNTNGGVEFTITNTGSSTVTITALTVTTSAGSAAEISEGNFGNGAGNREFWIEASANGYYEDASEGTYNLGDTGTLTDNADVDGGTSATISLFEFVNNGGNTVDMNGETVTVTITLSDGSETTFTANP